MKYLKFFENYKEVDNLFDNIYYQQSHGDSLTFSWGDFRSQFKVDQLLRTLNEKNNNFDPRIIKDFFIEYYDEYLITDQEMNKVYNLTKSTSTTNGVTKDAWYISYTIQVIFNLNNDSSEKYLKLRSKYLKERDEIREILENHYNHKSLNCDLNIWNYGDKETVYDNGSSEIFKKNKDKFDLWAKSHFL